MTAGAPALILLVLVWCGVALLCAHAAGFSKFAGLHFIEFAAGIRCEAAGRAATACVAGAAGFMDDYSISMPARLMYSQLAGVL